MHPSFLLFPLLAALPQAPEAQPSAPPRPVSPILLALDLNGDGILDADELAAAAQSLLKLDKTGDGQLTPDEYRPARPDGQTTAAPPARPTGQAREARPLERPRPPLDVALDEDGDEIISAAEIARAPLLLKKLDRNGDGRLTPDEYQPTPQTGKSPKADRA